MLGKNLIRFSSRPRNFLFCFWRSQYTPFTSRSEMAFCTNYNTKKTSKLVLIKAKITWRRRHDNNVTKHYNNYEQWHNKICSVLHTKICTCMHLQWATSCNYTIYAQIRKLFRNFGNGISSILWTFSLGAISDQRHNTSACVWALGRLIKLNYINRKMLISLSVNILIELYRACGDNVCVSNAQMRWLYDRPDRNWASSHVCVVCGDEAIIC